MLLVTFVGDLEMTRLGDVDKRREVAALGDKRGDKRGDSDFFSVVSALPTISYYKQLTKLSEMR